MWILDCFLPFRIAGSDRPVYSDTHVLDSFVDSAQENELHWISEGITPFFPVDKLRAEHSRFQPIQMAFSSLVTVTEDEKGHPLNVGRKYRVVPPAIRRALLARDRHCRFVGCTHDKWLTAHHVLHWAGGGETSRENCLLLCSAHHGLLHEGGFRIKADVTGAWQFAP